jgi:hypothetical protein
LSRVIYPTLFTGPEQKRIFEKRCYFPVGMFSIEFKRRERAGVRSLAPPADYAQGGVAGRNH